MSILSATTVLIQYNLSSLEFCQKFTIMLKIYLQNSQNKTPNNLINYFENIDPQS